MNVGRPATSLWEFLAIIEAAARATIDGGDCDAAAAQGQKIASRKREVLSATCTDTACLRQGQVKASCRTKRSKVLLWVTLVMKLGQGCYIPIYIYRCGGIYYVIGSVCVLLWNLHHRGVMGRKGREWKFLNKAHRTQNFWHHKYPNPYEYNFYVML